MTMPAKAEIDSATRDALAGLAVGDLEVLEELLELREAEQQKTGLDARTFALVKIAALVALDAPPASYLWQVANALDAGATPARPYRRAPCGRTASWRAQGGGRRAGDHGCAGAGTAGRAIRPAEIVAPDRRPRSACGWGQLPSVLDRHLG